MAVFLNNQVGVKVNSVDLSDHVSSVTLNRSFNELLVTSMGDSGQKQIKGLETSSVTIEFLNDTATSSVLATLQAAWGTNVTVNLVQTKGNPTTTISATNPLYTMTCLVNNTTDINGAVGDLSTQSVTWNVSGVVVVATTGTWA
jgi:hypothetical protein